MPNQPPAQQQATPLSIIQHVAAVAQLGSWAERIAVMGACQQIAAELEQLAILRDEKSNRAAATVKGAKPAPVEADDPNPPQD